MSRGQYSMEFMVMTAILAILFFAFLVNYADSLQQTFLDRENAEFTDAGESVRSALVAASKMHDGLKIELPPLPERIAGVDYTINNTPYVLYLRATKEGYSQDYIYSIPYTIGRFNRTNITIWNVKGVVALSGHPPILRPDGVVNFTQCNDLVDNDADSFIDLGDPNCTAWNQDNETG